MVESRRRSIWVTWDKFHQLPPLVYKDISSFIAGHIEKKRIQSINGGLLRLLDCGIGTGIISIPVMSHLIHDFSLRLSVLGVEKDPGKFDILNQRIVDFQLEQNINYIALDVESSQYDYWLINQKLKFDIILAIWFFHYLKNPIAFIQSFRHLVREGSLLFVGVSDNDTKLLAMEKNAFKKLKGNDHAKSYLFSTLKDHFSTTEYSSAKLIRYVIDNGFELIDKRSFKWFFHLTISDVLNLFKNRQCARPLLDQFSSAELSMKLTSIESKLGHQMLSKEIDLLMGLEIYAFEERSHEK